MGEKENKQTCLQILSAVVREEAHSSLSHDLGRFAGKGEECVHTTHTHTHKACVLTAFQTQEQKGKEEFILKHIQ